MKKRRKLVAGSLLGLSLLATSPVLASTNTNNLHQIGITGTVDAISGTTITLTAKNSTKYNVEASNAKIVKAGSTIALTAIQVGDTLLVKGKVSGTDVSATAIIDGIGFKKGVRAIKNEFVKGNITFGKITSLNGSTFTVESHNKNATTTISVTTTATTTFKKDAATASLTDLAVGEHVLIAGTKDSSGQNIAQATSIHIITQASSKPHRSSRQS